MNVSPYCRYIVRSLWVRTATVVLALSCVSAANATLVIPSGAETFTESGAGSQAGLQAAASFWVSGSQLMVNLANTSSNDVLSPNDILQAVYWDMASNISLSLTSAIVDQKCSFIGSSAYNCVANAIATVGNGNNGSQLANYKYNGKTTASPTGMRGIGSAGLNNFGGTGGGDWGILSAGDNLATYNGGMVSNSPYAKNSATFSLNINKNGKSYTPAQVGDLSIKNISFNYGTSYNLLDGALVPPATLPEPTDFALFPLAIGLMIRSLRKRQRRA